MLAPASSSVVRDVFAFSDERVGRTLQITIMTMIVVVVSMTFQIPDPALSTYIVFFVAKEDSGRSILISIIFIVAIVAVVGIVFLLIPLSLDHSNLRILVIAVASFAMFFLGRTSKLAPLANTLGLIMAYALDLELKAPVGEIATRGLLYVLLFAIFPIVVVIAFNVAFGRHPERLLREALALRITVVSEILRACGEGMHPRSVIAAGNVELLTELKMIQLFHRLSPDDVARLKMLITLSFGQLLTVVAPLGPERDQALDYVEADLKMAGRLVRLADAVRLIPDRTSLRTLAEGEQISPADPPHRLESLTALMERIVSGAPLPPPGAAEPKPPKSGFFKADAFSNPDGERFAAKATAAVMVCYLTFNLLDWPGISTCMITCFIVALSTVGESAQKMTLRLVGCTFGAVLGYVAIVFILPITTGIGGLLVLVVLITLPAAWIAVGSPRISYIGFQIAFAAYLCVLQGSEPKFDLTIARDRFIGIVFGNVTVCVIFTQIYATSLLPGLTRDLVVILNRCRAALKAIGEAEATPAIGEKIAGVYALLQKLDNEIVAYGFEKRPTRYGRLHGLSCRLISNALHNVVADTAAIAVRTAPTDDGVEGSIAEQCKAADRRLEDLATALVEHQTIATKTIDALNSEEAADSSAITVLSPDFRRLYRHVQSLTVTTARYRRILNSETGGAFG